MSPVLAQSVESLPGSVASKFPDNIEGQTDRDYPALVSIVIASYNHASYVCESIRSVIDQDYDNIELIIIDDGSTDNSDYLIREMIPECLARFRRFEFRARPNKGLTETLNEGLDWTRGLYFACLASDDVLLPNKTSVLVDALQASPGTVGVFGGCFIIDSVGKIIGTLRPRAVFYGFSEILATNYTIIASSQLLMRDAVVKVGGYPRGLNIEDWYMWLKLTERGASLRVIPQILIKYRKHANNISSNAKKMLEARELILKMFSSHRGIELAWARILVAASIDYSRSSKSEAFGYLAYAIGWHPPILLTARFWDAFARVLTPVIALDALKRLKKLTTSRTLADDQ